MITCVALRTEITMFRGMLISTRSMRFWIGFVVLEKDGETVNVVTKDDVKKKRNNRFKWWRVTDFSDGEITVLYVVFLLLIYGPHRQISLEVTILYGAVWKKANEGQSKRKRKQKKTNYIYSKMCKSIRNSNP